MEVEFIRGGLGSDEGECGGRTSLILGRVAIIHIKWLVFGDDFFQFSLDARGILLMSQFGKFFNPCVEPIEVVAISFQDKDLFIIGPNNSFPFGD